MLSMSNSLYAIFARLLTSSVCSFMVNFSSLYIPIMFTSYFIHTVMTVRMMA